MRGRGRWLGISLACNDLSCCGGRLFLAGVSANFRLPARSDSLHLSHPTRSKPLHLLSTRFPCRLFFNFQRITVPNLFWSHTAQHSASTAQHIPSHPIPSYPMRIGHIAQSRLFSFLLPSSLASHSPIPTHWHKSPQDLHVQLENDGPVLWCLTGARDLEYSSLAFVPLRSKMGGFGVGRVCTVAWGESDKFNDEMFS